MFKPTFLIWVFKSLLRFIFSFCTFFKQQSFPKSKLTFCQNQNMCRMLFLSIKEIFKLTLNHSDTNQSITGDHMLLLNQRKANISSSSSTRTVNSLPKAITFENPLLLFHIFKFHCEIRNRVQWYFWYFWGTGGPLRGHGLPPFPEGQHCPL